jgi:hypothetical protein
MDIPVSLDAMYQMQGPGGQTYMPYTLTIDASKLAKPEVGLYVRVVSKTPPPPPPQNQQNQNNRDRNQQQAQAPLYPWDQVYFVPVPATGKVSRFVQLRPGEYDVMVAVKERGVENPPRNAPPAKTGFFRRDLAVKDFAAADLQGSDVIVASAIEPLTTPLTPEQQQANPYALTTINVTPQHDRKVKTSGELNLIFFIYGFGHMGGKPNVVVDYNFYQKLPEGEKYFIKTAPQELNEKTLAPQFDAAQGHLLTSILVGVPLMRFPVGEYRMEIKVTDKITGKTFTRNESLFVEA